MGSISNASGPITLDAIDNPLTVTNTGTIMGTDAGVTAAGLTGTLTNAGSVLATGPGGTAIDFNPGGTLTNQPGGVIAGMGRGVLIRGAPGTITNIGSIGGSIGVELDAGGDVLNSGLILGEGAGLLVTNAAASLSNLGSIGAVGLSGIGADIEAGGTVLNAPQASIVGAQTGVVMGGGVSRLENEGTISGGTYAVRFLGTLDNRLVVDPSATFNGLVQGSASGSDTLELAGGSGTLSDFANGSGIVAEGGKSWAFERFGTIAVSASGAWDLAGSLAGDGTIAIAGSVDVSGTLDPASTHVFQIEGGTLEVAGALAGGAQIQFQPDSKLILDNFTAFGGIIARSTAYAGPVLQGFGVGDAIDLKTARMAPGSTLTYDPTAQVLEAVDGDGRMALVGLESSKLLAAGTFSAADDGAGGTLITFTPAKSPEDSDASGRPGSNGDASGTGSGGGAGPGTGGTAPSGGTGAAGPSGPASGNGVYNLSNTYNVTAATPNGTYNLSGSGQVSLGNGTNAINIASGADTIFAAADSGITAIMGGAGSVFFYAAPSSTEGVSLIAGGTGGNTIVGAANNAVVYAAAGDGSGALMVAGSGNETLFGAASAGNDQFWGDFNGGNDLLVAGSGTDALIAGTGNDTLIGGTGNDVFFVLDTKLLGAITNAAITPGQDFIENVHQGDVLALTGYDSLYGGAGQAAASVSAALASGADTVMLKDGTSLTFAGDIRALKVASS